MKDNFNKINFIIALSAIAISLLVPIIYMVIFAQPMFAPTLYDSPLTLWEVFIAIFASMLIMLASLTAIVVLQFKAEASAKAYNTVAVIGIVGLAVFLLIGVPVLCIVGMLTDNWVMASAFIAFTVASAGLSLWLFVRLRLRFKFSKSV